MKEDFKTEIEAIKKQIAVLENNINCNCKEEVESKRTQFTIKTYTQEQVVVIAEELAKRMVIACKEAVVNTDLDDSALVELELNYNNQIEINLNNEEIKENINSEIDDFVTIDIDSVIDEVGSIIEYLGY
jgi:hypothetical protein